ncbi:hypothetical protein NVP1179O_44 [Vibrio phage 1.179.O._10N.286.45.F12]|nr:hypothetical protein NVP1179O_44 [Vibrio phage 1.179.O._10N.286.45.F12]
MLQELVKKKACSIYEQAAKNVMDAAIAECSRMGLGHSASKELLAYVTSSDPKVPAVAESHLMAQIVDGVQLAVGVPVVGVSGDAGGSSETTEKEPTDTTKAVNLTATTLKQMSIEAVRESALELGIEITDQDGGSITKKDLSAAILDKQPTQ